MKIVKELLSYVIIIVVVVLIRSFIVTPVIIEGTSMNPTLQPNEIIMLNKLDQKYERFDIVVVSYNKERIIKRVIALPGETVKCTDGIVYINDEPIEDDFSKITADFDSIKLKDNYYFVMGDNRTVSLDSRLIGPIYKDRIQGSANLVIFPFTRFGFVD